MKAVAGTLYVVATPIGNVDDLSPRARQILASVSVVAAEDTRHTGQLLTRLGIDAQLASLHEQNEVARVGELLARLRTGDSVALVSDAGTPLLSDPGYRLVVGAREAGLPVSPVPGCSAVLAALSVAGLPTDRFRFEGFLPARADARRTRLRALAGAAETLVLFESVHRIGAMLADAAEAFGSDRPAAIARELTKVHETVHRATLGELARTVAADPATRRGEYTVVVAGAPERPPEAHELARVAGILAEELPASQAAGLAARITGGSRRDAYRLLLDRGSGGNGQRNGE